MQKKNRKSAWLLLFLPFHKGNIDTLYSHSFSNFGLSSATATSHAINFACATGHVTVGSTATIATGIASTAVVAGGIGVGVAVNNADKTVQPVQKEHIVVVDSIATATDSIENTDSLLIIDTTQIPAAIENKNVVDTTPFVAPSPADTLAHKSDTVASLGDSLPSKDEKVVVKRKKLIRKRVVVVKDSAQ